MFEGTLRGLAQCIRITVELLQAPLPTMNGERAANGAIEGAIRLLGRSGNRGEERGQARAKEGGEPSFSTGSSDMAAIAAVLTGSQDATDGLTNSQKAATTAAIMGKSKVFESFYLKAIEKDLEIRHLLAAALSAENPFNGGQNSIPKEQLIAAARLLASKFDSVAGAANLLAAAGGGPLSSPEVMAKAVRLIDKLIVKLRCPALGLQPNAAASLWLDVASGCQHDGADLETQALAFCRAEPRRV